MPRNSMLTLCQHSIVELHGCDPARLGAVGPVRDAMVEAICAAGGTIVKRVFHRFAPFGVSGVVVITESHVTVHTWPEHGYAAVDIFSCDERLDHRQICEALRERFGAARVARRLLSRGRVPGPRPKRPADAAATRKGVR